MDVGALNNCLICCWIHYSLSSLPISGCSRFFFLLVPIYIHHQYFWFVNKRRINLGARKNKMKKEKNINDTYAERPRATLVGYVRLPFWKRIKLNYTSDEHCECVPDLEPVRFHRSLCSPPFQSLVWRLLNSRSFLASNSGECFAIDAIVEIVPRIKDATERENATNLCKNDIENGV